MSSANQPPERDQDWIDALQAWTEAEDAYLAFGGSKAVSIEDLDRGVQPQPWTAEDTRKSKELADAMRAARRRYGQLLKDRGWPVPSGLLDI